MLSASPAVPSRFPAALRIHEYSQASCTIHSLQATLPTGLALPGDKKWDFFAEPRTDLTGPLQGVQMIEEHPPSS
jgi:hypothetical protein